MEVTREGLAGFFGVALPHLDESQRRVVAGAMSEMLGHGGKTAGLTVVVDDALSSAGEGRL